MAKEILITDYIQEIYNSLKKTGANIDALDHKLSDLLDSYINNNLYNHGNILLLKVGKTSLISILAKYQMRHSIFKLLDHGLNIPHINDSLKRKNMEEIKNFYNKVKANELKVQAIHNLKNTINSAIYSSQNSNSMIHTWPLNQKKVSSYNRSAKGNRIIEKSSKGKWMNFMHTPHHEKKS